LCGLIVGNHNPYAKRKKVCSRLERILSAKKARLHCLGTHSGTEIARQAADRVHALSPEIYPLSGLVCGLIFLLIGIRRPTAMHKILLAEDDNDMRRFLVKALENAGFQVSSHDNGLSAYQRLREEPFEMLLTDIVMPEMDGIELARRASELDPDIKIMFITGFAAVALNSDSEAPKNAKVLSKPVHLRELVSEVNKMLAA
jgi:two-component system, cell cycle response regulator CpdR